LKILALATLLFLTACSTSGPARDYRPYLSKKGVTDITLASIPHCHGYNCRLKTQATLTESEWKPVSKTFKGVKSPELERIAIARAVGQLERIVGEKTGTGTDVAGTYVQLGDDQHDCVDESVNTTVYLDLLLQKNLIRYHDISNISTRIPVFGGGMGFHQTAVVVERETAQRYAVDSWFHPNGQNAEIVPLADWLYGWHPKR